METVRSDPVCIPNREDGSDGGPFLDLSRCSFEEHEDNWQDLKRYWGNEKHRVHLLETQLSSSLEKHLLQDDCLNKPCEGDRNCVKDENSCYPESSYVRGEDIKDIPSSYVLKGFHPHEFVVIGTYIDKHILPGFKYRIRQNITNRYLFQGKAQFLERIGLGYGKRLTFASQCLNKNENYFWSDNSPDGFGFSLVAVSAGDEFSIVDCQTKSALGYVVVNGVEEQVEICSRVKNNGNIEKKVKVAFTCDTDIEKKLGEYSGQVLVSGTAILVKENESPFAKVKRIKLDSFIVENCELRPTVLTVPT